MKVAVSFTKVKYSIKDTIDMINNTSADYIHVDIMDGIFVENKNYEYQEIVSYLKDNHKPIDIHLMVSNPLDYIKEYLNLKPYNISFHLEAVNDPIPIINYLHQNNIKCGIAINPNTSLDKLIPYLDLIDTVLVMTVYPGKGGQPFIKEVVPKINELSKLKGNFIVEIDGGINEDSINYVNNADLVVSGAYICLSNNFEEKINKLR